MVRACDGGVEQVVCEHGAVVVRLAALLADPQLEVAKKAAHALLLIG